MPWRHAVAGVVRVTLVPTTPRWLVPAPPLLIQGGESSRALLSLFFEFDYFSRNNLLLTTNRIISFIRYPSAFNFSSSRFNSFSSLYVRLRPVA